MTPTSNARTRSGLPRRGLLQAGVALGLGGLALRVSACEFVTRTLTIVHPWTRASEPDASTAIVGMGLQDVRQDERLIGVLTPVAESAEMVDESAQHGHGTGRDIDLLIRAGETTVLGEAGVQLRLIGLKVPMQVGREYPLTLVFANAGPVLARLSVDYARFR